MEKIVLIPAYKPENKLTSLAEKLSENGLRVVIVDDGSGMSFRSIFDDSENYAEVIRCEENGGKGRALKRGLEYIKERFTPPYIIVTADADGQHKLPDILNAAEAAEKNPDSLVLGARTISRDMPTRNWFGNLYTRIAFLFAAGRLLGDTQTGLRGFSDRMLPFMLGVKGSRYEYEMNVLLHWARSNSPIEEVAISTVYEDGNSTSHFKVIRDSVNIYWQLVKFSATAFLSFALDVALFAALLCFGLQTFGRYYFLIDFTVNLLLFLDLILTAVFCVPDRPARFVLLTAAGIFLIFICPLLAVTPVGARNAYFFDVLLILITMTLLRQAIRSHKLLPGAAPALILAACLLLCGNLWIHLRNGAAEGLRNQIVSEAMERGEREITLPGYPYPDYIHGAGSVGALSSHYYYDVYGDISFRFVTYRQWIESR